PGWNHTTRQVSLGDVHLGRHRAVEQGQVDGVAVAALLPRPQTGQDGDRRVEAGQHVGHGNADLERRPFHRPGYAHEPAERLDREIIPGDVRQWTTSSEAGDGANHQARVEGNQFLHAQADPRDTGRQKVLQEYVRAADELVEDADALLLAQVQRERLLVA